jgi:hypothetical protein
MFGFKVNLFGVSFLSELIDLKNKKLREYEVEGIRS